jgi:hypothetical protein
MPVNLLSVALVTGEWTDLYESTGIPVGSKLGVHNISSSDIRLTSVLLQPQTDSDMYQIIQPNNLPMTNDTGDQGAWAMSLSQNSKLQVWQIL